jgi:glycosyltransferase involved in cell wall biosynthesis
MDPRHSLATEADPGAYAKDPSVSFDHARFKMSLPQDSPIPSPFPEGLAGKRAAVVLYSYYPDDPRPRRAAEAMIRVGMHVDLICLHEGNHESRSEVVSGVNVVRLPIRKKRAGKLSYVAQYSQFLFACSIILAYRTVRRRYDVVHVHNMPDFLVFSALVPKLFGSKVLLDLHDPMPELIQCIYNLPLRDWLVRMLTRLERWSIAVADMVLTPNTAFRDLFVARGCPVNKLRIVMNSPHTELFDPEKFNSQATSRNTENVAFRLMYHGLIAKRHGLDIALNVVARLRESIPALEFHIYGSRTAYMDQMSHLIRKLGLEEIVHYHGRKSQSEIAQALASADLGVIPNRRSPFTELNMPTRIFENLAMGKPVIVPNTKGIRDYFNENQIIFFEPANVESLANAVKWVYQHPQDAQKIVASGRKVLQAHTWNNERDHFIASLEDLFRRSQEYADSFTTRDR